MEIASSPIYRQSTGKDYERERDGDGENESQLDGFPDDGGTETEQNVADDVAVVEGDDAEEADAEVDGGDHVDGAVDDVQHALQRRIRHVVVDGEQLSLTGEGQAENRETFQDSRGPPIGELMGAFAPFVAEQTG